MRLSAAHPDCVPVAGVSAAGVDPWWQVRGLFHTHGKLVIVRSIGYLLTAQVTCQHGQQTLAQACRLCLVPFVMHVVR